MGSLKLNLVRGAMLAVIAIGAALWSLPAAADAAATYKGKCAMCHGADGKGDTAAGKKMGAHDFASPRFKTFPMLSLSQLSPRARTKCPGTRRA